MVQAQGWADLAVAQAALSDPNTSTFELLSICMAQPQLRAGAALHRNADVNLLTWIAGQDEPVAAATARSRLDRPSVQVQPQAGQVQPQAGQPQYAPAADGPAQLPGKRSGTRIAVWSGAGVLALALIVVVAVVVVPKLTNAGKFSYAPDLRELPGLVSVDAQQGLPKGDYSWSTYFYEAADAGYLIASNSTSAYDDYQNQLSSYNDALASLKQWEADYQSGYASGQVCLSESSESYYYQTRADYCVGYQGNYLNVQDAAAEAGFSDSVNGLAASPDRPGDSDYQAPQVPAKPTEPKAGGNLVGIELKTGKVAWKIDLASVWADAHPQVASVQVSGDQALVLLNDVATDSSDAPLPEMLSVLNVKTGALGANTTFDSDQTQVVLLHGDIAVLADKDGALRGVSTSDLTTQKWTSAARAAWWNSEDSPYWISDIPGDYLLTDDGYLRMTDGRRADFARDAGQDSIQLGQLNGTSDQLIRIQGTESSYDVSGFDSGKDEQTWQLSGVNPVVWSAASLLIAASAEGEIDAYRVNGKELDRQWRYSCGSGCGVSFADNSRVVISEWESPSVVVLNTADGHKIDSLDNPDGGDPMVGRTVLYLRQDQRLVARDLDKSGLPVLWRSIPVDGSLSQIGDQFVIEDEGEGSGKVGIIGLDGDDWNDFKAKEG